MNPSRRGLFGLFAGALAAPVLAKLPAAPVALDYRPMSAASSLSLSEIVTATLRAHSSQIVDNMMRRSALLEHLTAQG